MTSTTHADITINPDEAESASQVIWRAVQYLQDILKEDEEGSSSLPLPTSFTLSDLRRIAANLATDPTVDSQLYTADRPTPSFYHVFGGPFTFLRDGTPFTEFTYFTYGPTYMPGNSDVRSQGYPFQGTTFPYLGSFDHDPTDDERASLKPVTVMEK